MTKLTPEREQEIRKEHTNLSKVVLDSGASPFVTTEAKRAHGHRGELLSHITALQQENDDTRHDIEEYIKTNTELHARVEEIEQDTITHRAERSFYSVASIPGTNGKERYTLIFGAPMKTGRHL